MRKRYFERSSSSKTFTFVGYEDFFLEVFYDDSNINPNDKTSISCWRSWTNASDMISTTINIEAAEAYVSSGDLKEISWAEVDSRLRLEKL